MTSLERVLAVFHGQQADRIPVIPIIGQAAARLNGITMSEELQSPETLAESRIACLKRFGYDGLYISADTWVAAEAMGAPVEYADDAPTAGTTPLLDDMQKLDQLKASDPKQDGRLPFLVKAVEIASSRSNDTFAVIANFDQSPFSLACALRGINQLMLDVYDQPDCVTQLLDICAESVIRYAKALAEAGAHILNTGDSPAILVGPQHYEKFALPYEQIVFDELKAYGIPTVLHICGNTTKVLSKMGQSHATGLEIDHAVDLHTARNAVPGTMTLIGNIDPVEMLLNASPEKISSHVKSLLDESPRIGQFILSSGCTLAPHTPPENIAAMVQVARS
ncbi:hypothetical protein CSA56_02045 [candidate division KSB3 bacterium]|uniref:Uroporphyrinogen decarboxylase (URO-D) domain-containing protein n=1 Tax=candidate division KSB3 bacterium TaxID=2044937 RepID=A0A2G6KKL6_9BACT|nr:MAG: hypothetical protein CSA56_02045 [candidate division KSB3 bacterium]